MVAPRIHVVGAAILRHDQCLVALRGSGMSAPGCWEFPGGKVEPGEPPEAALIREIAEEIGVVIEVGDLLGRGVAKSIDLDVYAARIVSGQPSPREHAKLCWLGANELPSLAWAAADVPIVTRVIARLRRG